MMIRTEDRDTREHGIKKDRIGSDTNHPRNGGYQISIILSDAKQWGRRTRYTADVNGGLLRARCGP
jgi:hypothetical protein